MARIKKTTKKILVLGPDRRALSGVSTHLNQLFNSNLSVNYDLIQFQVGSEGLKEQAFKKVLRLLWSPVAFSFMLFKYQDSIIHLNTSMDSKAFWRDILYLLISKFLRKKVIYQVHGGELPQTFSQGNASLRALLAWLLRLPDAIILLADVELIAYQKFSRCKHYFVVANAIDLNQYLWAKERSYESNKFRLVYIGRLVNSKGINEAIEAFDILRRQSLKNLDFFIAGSGPAESSIREKVRTLGLEDSVRLVGPVYGEQKKEFWRKADIFVFPTYHKEGLPYALLESIASATPVVTTRVGGIPDVICDGVHGRFVEIGDVRGIANAIQSMISDRNGLRKMSMECLSRAKANYGIDRLVDQFSAIYQTVAE